MYSADTTAWPRIAENQINVCFPVLENSVRKDLVTSLVRQWQTYHGIAVIFTSKIAYRFTLKAVDDQWHVGQQQCTNPFLIQIAQFRLIISDEEWHRLNLCQYSNCQGPSGETYFLRSNPGTNTFELKPASEESLG